jgi:hypothetical protein
MFPTQQASDESAFGLGRMPAASGNAPAVSRLASLGRGPAIGQTSNKHQGIPSAPTPPGIDYSLPGAGGPAGSQPMLQMQDDFARLGLDTGGIRDRFAGDPIRSFSQLSGVSRLPDLSVMSSPADPRSFMSGSPVHHLNDMMGTLGSAGMDGGSAASNKGSRFAKLWENEARRGAPVGGMSGPADLNTFGPGLMSRDMDVNQFGIRPETNMNDILAMLNGSHPVRLFFCWLRLIVTDKESSISRSAVSALKVITLHQAT